MIPGSVAGVLVNVAGNFLLIPHYGAWGAAWAGVITYIAFSFTTLLMCRSVRNIAYPWKASLFTFSGICASYLALRYALFPVIGLWMELAASVVCCGLWAAALFGRDGLQWWSTRGCSANSTSHARSPEKSDVSTAPAEAAAC
jgi:O-antigen/teichoic acid export membrane protein